jgi:hypothetical protein
VQAINDADKRRFAQILNRGDKEGARKVFDP